MQCPSVAPSEGVVSGQLCDREQCSSSRRLRRPLCGMKLHDVDGSIRRPFVYIHPRLNCAGQVASAACPLPSESPDGSQFETVPLSNTGDSTGMQRNTLRAPDRSTRSVLAWVRSSGPMRSAADEPTTLYGSVGYNLIRIDGDLATAVRRTDEI